MTSSTPISPGQGRLKCFDDTHQEMIETAVRLISEKGIDSLSIAALTRAMGIHRTTVYYHFDNREALLKAVKAWSSEQLAKAFTLKTPREDRIDYITRFVLENPELIKLWIEDWVSVGDVRDSYPHWDELVTAMRERLAAEALDTVIDAEVYCVSLLTSAIIGPRVFKNRVCPDADIDTVVRLFREERKHQLDYDALFS
jgi:AcrR family transcriptional regulator